MTTAGVKYDEGKLQYSLIPPYALREVARNLTAGLIKYEERDNWKKVAGAKERYLDAAYRHLEAHRRGEVYDTESDVKDMTHLAAAAVNLMFLLEFMYDPKLKTDHDSEVNRKTSIDNLFREWSEHNLRNQLT